MLAFGATTIHMIITGEPSASRSDLLLFASGVGALVSAFVWFFLVAVQRSLLWSLVLLVPVVNTLVLPVFIRRYWGEGTRWPALMALLGLGCELTGAALLLLGTAPSLV